MYKCELNSYRSKELGKSLLAYAFTVQYIAAEERRIKLEPENSTAILGCIIALMNSSFYTKLFNDITVQNVSDEVKAVKIGIVIPLKLL